MAGSWFRLQGAKLNRKVRTRAGLAERSCPIEGLERFHTFAAPPIGGCIGEVAEWSKARAWKVRIPVKGYRGFESLPLRQRTPRKRGSAFKATPVIFDHAWP